MADLSKSLRVESQLPSFQLQNSETDETKFDAMDIDGEDTKTTNTHNPNSDDDYIEDDDYGYNYLENASHALYHNDEAMEYNDERLLSDRMPRSRSSNKMNKLTQNRHGYILNKMKRSSTITSLPPCIDMKPIILTDKFVSVPIYDAPSPIPKEPMVEVEFDICIQTQTNCGLYYPTNLTTATATTNTSANANRNTNTNRTVTRPTLTFSHTDPVPLKQQRSGATMDDEDELDLAIAKRTQSQTNNRMNKRNDEDEDEYVIMNEYGLNPLQEDSEPSENDDDIDQDDNVSLVNTEDFDDDETFSKPEPTQPLEYAVSPKSNNNENAVSPKRPKVQLQRMHSEPVTRQRHTRVTSSFDAFSGWDYNDSDSSNDDFIDTEMKNNCDGLFETNILDSQEIFVAVIEELAITSKRPSVLFEELIKLCQDVKLSKNKKIPFSSQLFKTGDDVQSFLKCLGFMKVKAFECWAINRTSAIVTNDVIDCGLEICQNKLFEIQSKSSMYRRHISAAPTTIIHEKLDFYSNSVPDVMDGVHTEIADALTMRIYELIWSVTHHSNSNYQQSKETLLLCYFLQISSTKFLQLLCARYVNDDHLSRMSQSISNSTDTDSTLSLNSSLSGISGFNSLPSVCMSPGNPSSFSFENMQIQSSEEVRQKIVNVINQWMLTYWKEDWDENQTLQSNLEAFVSKVTVVMQRENNIEFDEQERKREIELINVLRRTLRKQKKETKRAREESNSRKHVPSKSNTDYIRKRKKSSLISPRRSSSRNSFNFITNDILTISNRALSEQITLMLFDSFSGMTARECVRQFLNKEKAPNAQKCKLSFNNLVKYVQSSILIQNNLNNRARVIKKWIKICNTFLFLHNFQGVVAVHCALSSNPIFKLKKAWFNNNILKKKHRSKFGEFKELMDPYSNFQNLRAKQRNSHPPMVPYFGLFLKDSIGITETISKGKHDGSMNWNQLWRISDLIKTYLKHVQIPYTHKIQRDDMMQQWLMDEMRKCGTLKTNHLEKMSIDVASQDKKNVKHTKSLSHLI